MGFCGSAFFITLDKADELNPQHTVFGKLIDMTVYNLAEIESCKVKQDFSPCVPIFIRRISILKHNFTLSIPVCPQPHFLGVKLDQSITVPNKIVRKFTLSVGEDETEKASKVKSFHAVHKIQAKNFSIPEVDTFPQANSNKAEENAHFTIESLQIKTEKVEAISEKTENIVEKIIALKNDIIALKENERTTEVK